MSIRKAPGPPKIAPKPKTVRKPMIYPKARVQWEYDACDNDEISLKDGQIVEASHPLTPILYYFISSDYERR